ncbi:MAG: branched-chain alpha-keto acid dehydrogenase subunit [Actinotalea sp.]|nr:branched-chain alpha-keto acid dehydrogenase subunit [Actinotalea sp.]
MPDLGEGLTEAELVSWSVAVGDTVELNQLIAEVETAKALVQLPSPFAGVVSRLFVEPGTTVPVGDPILAIEVEELSEDPAGSTRPPGRAAGDGPEVDHHGGRSPARNAVLVGYGPPVEGSARPRRRERAASWSGGQPVEAAPGGSGASTSVLGTTAGTPAVSERPRSYPPVRKLAHDLGVDLTRVPATGPQGTITRDDVLTWVAAGDSASGGLSAGSPSLREPRPPRETRTKITGVRRRTAAAMVASAFTAPHATEFLTIDVTPTMELVQEIAADRRFSGRRVSILTMVAKAVTIALRRTPSLNARWDEDAGEIVEFGYVNLGIAAATPRGLIVPNIKDADALDLAGLADGITRLTESARAGTTAPADLTGGTISITNIGVFGIDAGTPILNPGEAAILASGAVRRRPWEYRDEVALRSVMTLSLSFDHRLVDGEQASRFLSDVGTVLARPDMTMTMV